jgi:hypothetical protein
MTRTYTLSPSIIPDLQAAIDANFRDNLNPVVLQQVGSDDRGFLEIRVRAYGTTEENVHALCLMAERGTAIILPARNWESDRVGEPGTQFEFDGELYHVGVHTSQFGQQFIHRFSTLDGQNEITWKTGKPQPLGRYKVTCRVKGYTDFGYIEQTTVTHCKLTKLEE